MTTNLSDRDVAVVGAGPVGLSLALGVARAGRSVCVLEKESSTAEHTRAPVIWPRTQEVLAEFGGVERFLEQGMVLSELQLWDADHDRTLLRLPFRELSDETDYPQVLILPQSVTERLLLQAVELEPSAEVWFDTEAVEVMQEGADSVRIGLRNKNGPNVLQTRFAAGCDGARSTVRECINADFPGVTYDTRAALADVQIPAEDQLRFPRLTARRRIALGLRLRVTAGNGALWRLILPFSTDDELPLGERIDQVVENLLDTKQYETVWKSEFRLHRRVASSFVDGRVVLAGDAAHLNSPVGGQGMNAGIQDAGALIPVLLEALDRDAPELLKSYGSQRRQQIVEGVNRFTGRLTRVLLVGRGRFPRLPFRLLSLASAAPFLRQHMLRRIAMLDRKE